MFRPKNPKSHNSYLNQWRRLTEASRAVPVQLASRLPRKENKRNETSAPVGVADAKIRIYFLHSSRGRPADSREEASARDVGAEV